MERALAVRLAQDHGASGGHGLLSLTCLFGGPDANVTEEEEEEEQQPSRRV